MADALEDDELDLDAALAMIEEDEPPPAAVPAAPPAALPPLVAARAITPPVQPAARPMILSRWRLGIGPGGFQTPIDHNNGHVYHINATQPGVRPIHYEKNPSQLMEVQRVLNDRALAYLKRSAAWGVIDFLQRRNAMLDARGANWAVSYKYDRNDGLEASATNARRKRAEKLKPKPGELQTANAIPDERAMEPYWHPNLYPTTFKELAESLIQVATTDEHDGRATTFPGTDFKRDEIEVVFFRTYQHMNAENDGRDIPWGSLYRECIDPFDSVSNAEEQRVWNQPGWKPQKYKDLLDLRPPTLYQSALRTLLANTDHIRYRNTANQSSILFYEFYERGALATQRQNWFAAQSILQQGLRHQAAALQGLRRMREHVQAPAPPLSYPVDVTRPPPKRLRIAKGPLPPPSAPEARQDAAALQPGAHLNPLGLSHDDYLRSIGVRIPSRPPRRSNVPEWPFGPLVAVDEEDNLLDQGARAAVQQAIDQLGPEDALELAEFAEQQQNATDAENRREEGINDVQELMSADDLDEALQGLPDVPNPNESETPPTEAAGVVQNVLTPTVIVNSATICALRERNAARDRERRAARTARHLALGTDRRVGCCET